MHRGPRGKSSTNNDRAAVAPRQLLGSDRGVGGGPAAPTLSPNPGQAMRVYLYPQHATAATFPQSDIHGMQSRVHATCFLRSLWGGGQGGPGKHAPPPELWGLQPTWLGCGWPQCGGGGALTRPQAVALPINLLHCFFHDLLSCAAGRQAPGEGVGPPGSSFCLQLRSGPGGTCVGRWRGNP